MKIIVRLNQPLTTNVSGAFFSELLNGRLTLAEFRQSFFAMGRREIAATTLFQLDVEPGQGADPETESAQIDSLLFEGDFSRLDDVGRNLSTGLIECIGSLGNRVGQNLQSGTILVTGHVGDLCGASMKSGSITVEGNAGDGLGAPADGNQIGMRGGTIFVRGNVRHFACRKQRGGLVIVAGDCGDMAAQMMVAGTLVIGGRVGHSIGLGMKRGTLVLLNDEASCSLPDSFAENGLISNVYLQLLKREVEHVTRGQVVVPASFPLRYYRGDLQQTGLGEVFIADRTLPEVAVGLSFSDESR